jgi:peptide/nickel transport system permease protein
VAGIVKKPSVVYLVIIIGLIRWTSIAKFIRAELLKIRTLGYIEAGKALGFSEYRLMIYHAIPNALHPVIISFAFGIASSILIESSLSFLGIGVAPEAVTWGSMLEVARNDFSAWWLAVFPGITIFISVITFNLIGEGLSDALNPKE